MPAVEATKVALESWVPVIFEASLQGDGAFAAVDILQRVGDGFSLLEVKATLSAKPQHLPDLAIQVHLARRAGLRIDRIEVMHLNRDHRHPDVEPLFARTDVTEDVEELVPGVAREIAGQLAMLEGACPDVATGTHCEKPYACPFTGRCWLDRPKHDVSELYSMSRKAETLRERGYEVIAEIPDDVRLGDVATRQRRAVVSGKLVVEDGLGAALAAIREPIAFLDFETVGLALPVWHGCAPYQAVPVQFSVHRLDPAGIVAHHEFLADAGRDPREDLARQLLESTKGAATVLAWSAGFERERIEELTEVLPHLADALRDLAARIADLLPIVRNHVYHPEFRGSFSLKSVGPALAPELAYTNLEVAEGMTASLHLERYLLYSDGLPEEERKNLRAALLAYCKRDTEILVRVLRVLQELAR
jgi:hypothetical protein